MEKDEDERKAEVFLQFVCDGKRFIGTDSISSYSKLDGSASFVKLKDETYCQVRAGLQLLVTEGLVPRFLKVTFFVVERKGILGQSPTIIRPSDDEEEKWIRMDDIVCSVIAFRQPLRDSATQHESERIAIPTLNFT